jgi:hypothetical protein
MATLVTLKDGYQLPDSFLISTTIDLQVLKQENYFAFFNLVQKCENAGCIFLPIPFGNSKATLENYAFIDKNGAVPENIEKIVLNSIKKSGPFIIRLVNPIAKKQVALL